MSDTTYIKDNIFHYKGVDYSIFAKWKDLENGTEDDVVIKKNFDGDSVSIYNRKTKSYLVASVDRLILQPYGEKRVGGGGKFSRFKFDASGTKLLAECAGWKLYYKKIEGKDGKKDTYVNKLVKDKETQSDRGNWEHIKGVMLTSEAFKWNKSDQTFEKWGGELTPDQIKGLCATLSMFYKGKEEQPVPEPAKPKSTTSAGSTVEIFKPFKTPKELREYNGGELARQKMNCLEQLEAMLDSFDEEVRRDKEFIRKYLPNKIWFVNPINGEPFQPHVNKEKQAEANRHDYILFLTNILYLGGVDYFDIGANAIEGFAVNIEGEANYEENKRYNRQKDTPAYRKFVEYDKTGGLATLLQWHGLMLAIQVAKNYITNYYVASFKYPVFTDEFKKLFIETQVTYEDKNYKNEVETVTGKLYYRNFDDGKWLYILMTGSYAGLYSNDFLIGYSIVSSMVSKQDYLLSYVKDVGGFTEGLTSGSRPYKQLLENYPFIFGIKVPEPEPIPEPVKYSLDQDIKDVEFLMSLEKDPIEYVKLKKELDDIKFLKSLS